MSTYQSVSLHITGPAHHTDGMATEHAGEAFGHVTIYVDGGAWSVRADSAETLRSLAEAFRNAADALDAERQPVTTQRPVAAMGGVA